MISVSGLVQGIGFRPFVYRLAVKNGLKGNVLNLGDAGVRIDVNGEERDIRRFLKELRVSKPPLASYTSIGVNWQDYSDSFTGFDIVESDARGKGAKFSLIPPDISICDPCLQDIFDPRRRHFAYPFTSCAICGPRFTTITDLPYDRERTTMVDFPLCSECRREFTDPADRRFNAQTICCPDCGPRMELCDNVGRLIEGEDPIEAAAKLLDEGFIVAIKGIGGIHIAVKATDDAPVLRLRRRRRKPNKPFAVMSPDIEAIKRFARVSNTEASLLTSYARPIVALGKREPFPLSEHIAPGLHTVGVMLPYSGIHYLLFRYSKEPALVMTSANLPDQPMVISNKVALDRIRHISDYFLLHDREIWSRCDDSVIKVVDDEPYFLRRSRGYSPIPILLPFHYNGNIVAVGPELSSTASVLKEGGCYLTQHIGDVNSVETLGFLDQAIRNLLKLLRVGELRAVACDMHPLFSSRRIAEELTRKFHCPLVEVQHHHAHLAKLMVEGGVSVDQKVVGIVCDGVGYGLDGTPWGGEILVGDYRDFARLGHLEAQPMPGGDLCAYNYGRMLQGVLYGNLDDEELREFLAARCLPGFAGGKKEVDIVFEQIKREINTPFTTSTGRLLDAASCLLGICYRRTYEGEGAIKMEARAVNGDSKKVDLPRRVEKVDGRLVLKTSPMMMEMLNKLQEGCRSEDLAASFQEALAKGLASIAIKVADTNGLGKIGFTGGVAYNQAMTSTIKSEVENEGYEFLRHRLVPCGDGGISLGQAVVAAVREAVS